MIRDTVPKTLRERLAAAWVTFKVKRKADPLAYQIFLAQQDAYYENVVRDHPRLQGYVADTFAGLDSTGHIVDYIERWRVEDQYEVIHHLAKKKPMLVVTSPALDKWASTNASAMAKITREQDK